MIEVAFHDALEIDPLTGRPTQAAMEAVEWIETDYRGVRIPLELRPEFYLSLNWCASWLSLDADSIREWGLPKPAPVFVNGKPNARCHIAGLPDVRRRWAAAYEAHCEKVAAGWDPEQERARIAERERAKRIAHQKRHRERVAQKAQQTAFPATQANDQGGDDAVARREVPGAFCGADRHVPGQASDREVRRDSTTFTAIGGEVENPLLNNCGVPECCV